MYSYCYVCVFLLCSVYSVLCCVYSVFILQVTARHLEVFFSPWANCFLSILQTQHVLIQMLFRTVIAVFKCRKMFYLNYIFCKIMRVAHKVLQHFLYFIEDQQISECEQHY